MTGWDTFIFNKLGRDVLLCGTLWDKNFLVSAPVSKATGVPIWTSCCWGEQVERWGSELGDSVCPEWERGMGFLVGRPSAERLDTCLACCVVGIRRQGTLGRTQLTGICRSFSRRADTSPSECRLLVWVSLSELLLLFGLKNVHLTDMR